ncbi:MAG: cytochrome c [Pseudorhodoplanes sp.]|nr:MAG: cytochrome c [Pseudorhodoplanes sp.]
MCVTSSTWRWWPSAILMFGLAVAAAAASERSPDTEKLTHLVRQDCGGCHGLTLKGGLGKPLTAEHLGQWNRDQLTSIILNGVPGTPMPGWRALMSEDEARWIADLLKRGTLR